ncbi:hypothetical protein N0V90_008102 [Kalmusia sp. IMI 367209]|nr:hypothetical protein N0V90_008102 [Kalmusia sp. IMI 367209]
MNGRLNRLYELRDRYRVAVANVPATAARRTDPEIQARGVKFARAQKQFNLELANRRRVTAHSGTPMGLATQVPTTSPQFLGLILQEQRRVATALEALAGLVPIMQGLADTIVQALQAAQAAGQGGGQGDSDDSDDDDDGGALVDPLEQPIEDAINEVAGDEEAVGGGSDAE